MGRLRVTRPVISTEASNASGAEESCFRFLGKLGMTCWSAQSDKACHFDRAKRAEKSLFSQPFTAENTMEPMIFFWNVANTMMIGTNEINDAAKVRGI